MYHILLAEDTPDKRAFLSEAIDDANTGAPIICKDHASEALAHIQVHAREIVAAFIDYTFQWEELVGTDLIKALRELNRECLILLVTSHPRASEEFTRRKELALANGANDALSTNMLPYNAGDWIYMMLMEKRAEWKAAYGLEPVTREE